MSRCLILLLALVASAWLPATATAEPAPCATLPHNIIVPAAYETAVEVLLAQSSTLRRQCRAIASAPHVRVTLHAGQQTGRCRARTSFTRSGSGLLRARIEIPVSIDFPELLAHEFEHVLEQIEGLNLKRMSRLSRNVWEVSRNVFETERARDAGRRAAAELEPCAHPLSRTCRDALAVVAAKD